VNIAQSAKRLVFCCTLRAGDLAVAMEGGKLRILQEGRHAKFVPQLQQVCFHGPSAFARGQQVLYVTERAVFELTHRGLALRELAPGIGLETQVLSQMAFTPEVGEFSPMPAACFETF
jgi:acyl CoA:acetate/3-ketoacid CoA transferase